MPLSRKQIAWRAAQDLADGVYVNLGIGVFPICVFISSALPPCGR